MDMISRLRVLNLKLSAGALVMPTGVRFGRGRGAPHGRRAVRSARDAAGRGVRENGQRVSAYFTPADNPTGFL
jgi:hypothetical protein